MRLVVIATAAMALMLINSERADAQGICNNCQGPIGNQWCNFTYESGQLNCLQQGGVCMLSGGACGGGKTFLSPDGSSRVLAAHFSRSIPASASGFRTVPSAVANTSTRVVAGPTGELIVDCQQQVVDRRQTKARVEDVRRLTRLISL